MIYLAYLYGERVLYALYGEVKIKCVNTELSRQFIQDIKDRSIDTTATERQHAHFWPEHRGICWYKKIPHTEQDWSNFLYYGVVQQD
jgi:hypothetical protein